MYEKSWVKEENIREGFRVLQICCILIIQQPNKMEILLRMARLHLPPGLTIEHKRQHPSLILVSAGR